MEEKDKKDNALYTKSKMSDYKLFCELISFYFDEKSDTVFYKIYLKSSLTNQEWEVNRRYSDFHDYHTIMSCHFFSLPPIPNKTLTKVTKLPDLEYRKKELNKFIKVSNQLFTFSFSFILKILKKKVVTRSDTMSSMATYHFLELSHHYSDFKLFQAFVSYEIENLPMEATYLNYSEEGNLLFLGLAKLGKTGSIINKVCYYIFINFCLIF